MRANDIQGADGQKAVADYLKGIGFRILDRDWRQPEGWIDILAVERSTLVVCDVKIRSGTRSGRPLGEVSRSRQRKLRKLAVAWLTAHGMRFDQIRLDVVGLLYEGTGGFTIEHIRGVG